MISTIWILLGIAIFVLHSVTGEEQSVTYCAMLLCFCLSYLVDVRNMLRRES